MPTALITGASRGFGFAVAKDLADRGWSLVVDARDSRALDTAREALGGRAIAVPGDVADAAHRADLARAVEELDGLDLLLNNASTLGQRPLRPLATVDTDALARTFAVNLLAPLALTQLLLPRLRESGGAVVDVSSDAAVAAYPTWGGYGASKAALDQATAVLAEEEPDLRVYSFDPGDMRTRMHQDAFPGEDIGNRPAPESVVPALLRMLEQRLPSGRYRAADLASRPAVTA